MIGGIMDKNNIMLKISLMLIIVSAIGAIIAINISTLDEPVFLMNYREIGTYENEGIYSVDEGFFNLQYISNLEDKRRVTGIKFKEATGTTFFASENRNGTFFYEEDNLNIVKCGRYGIHTVYLSSSDLKYEDDKNEIILSDATVEFDDGSNIDVDLGKIILYKEKNNPVAMKNQSLGLSNDGVIKETAMRFQMDEDVVIEKIESSFLEEASDIFDFRITTMDIYENKEANYVEGTPINRNSIITVSSTYNVSKDILKKYTICDIKPEIFFVNNYNDRYSVRCDNITNYEPYSNSDYDYCEIYRYLKARGEI